MSRRFGPLDLGQDQDVWVVCLNVLAQGALQGVRWIGRARGTRHDVSPAFTLLNRCAPQNNSTALGTTQPLTPFFSLLQSRALLTFQQLSLTAPSGLGGNARGLLAAGGRVWPDLRRLKKEETGDAALRVLFILGCLF